MGRLQGKITVAVSFFYCCGIVCCMSVVSNAQNILVTGTVVDTKGKPIRGVCATLASTRDSALTDSIGQFAIKHITPIIKGAQLPERQGPEYRYSPVSDLLSLFIFSDNTYASVFLVDVRGREVATLLNARCLRGTYTMHPLSLSETLIGPGFYLLVIRMNGKTWVRRVLYPGRAVHPLSTQSFSRTGNAPYLTDSVFITKNGYHRGIKKIDTLWTDIGTIPLRMLPVCRILNPVQNKVYQFGDSVEIQAVASDPEGSSIKKVQFLIDNEPFAALTTPPFTCTWNTVRSTVGTRFIRVTAYNDESMECSDSVTITVASSGVKMYGYRVVNRFAHDSTAFTQGLVYHNGFLYEGTGIEKASTVRKVDIVTGAVLQSVSLDSIYFGEGIDIVDDRLLQLTWQHGVLFVYDKNSFRRIKEVPYPRTVEGWGLTHRGNTLIESNGSNKLYFWDDETFKEVHPCSLAVTDGGTPLYNLNELEFFHNKIWANVWYKDDIVMIDPSTGTVVGKVDCKNLLSDSGRHTTADVLNGIAFDKEHDRLFVTGKFWPWVYEIALVPK